MLNSKIFYINSFNRTGGTASNFSYDMNLPPNANYTHVSVLKASVPKSYYMVQDGFNFFTLRENVTEYTITIPIGNYSRSSFITKLQALLNASGSWTYTVSIPDTTSGEPETGKLTFTVSGNSSVQPDFIFTDYMYEMMGFNDNTTVSFIGDVLTSVNVINLQKEATLFIHSDLVNNPDDNILQELFAENTSDYGNIVYQSNDIIGTSKPVSNLNSTFQFYLTDENDKLIDINGRNWQITLVLFKKENINNILKQYIKYKMSK